MENRHISIAKIQKQGFTLVELIVVMAAIMTLSLLGYARYTSFVKKANKATFESHYSTLRAAITLYEFENGELPDDQGDLGKALSQYVTDVSIGDDVFAYLETTLKGSEYKWESASQTLTCTLDEANSGIAGGYKKVYNP